MPEVTQESPWTEAARSLEEKQGPCAGYVAWEAWFSRECDDYLPEEFAPILDTLDTTQKAYLYNLMERLACGEFSTPKGA